MPFLVTLLLCLAALSRAQTAEYVYRDPADSSANCYLKILPKGKPIGLIVRDFSALPDTAKTPNSRFHLLAAEKGIMTVFTVTSKAPLELYFDDTAPSLLDDIIHEVVVQHEIPADAIFIGGISASGTRALRYAEYCERGKSKYGYRMRGVFAVDPPLDQERFYNSSVRILRRNYQQGNLWEADLVVRTFTDRLGGSPQEFPERYRNASVYSYSDTLGGNASHYKELAIRLYHEPDIDWWLQNRHESYYEINSIDIAAFANDLRTLGNANVELITTSGKGFDKDGKSKSHS